ncbi:TetR/AcrR family transcriptional regulator C-terminal domain-containing protein (plasmid) [Agrobacterium salinitolerans]|uniref:TetR/AcrR family transcriptional regulator C-terminal domain-containing protein n=1 Tax=Agrobacterium salinitolerans TaxID=1183413 RepID=UPI001C23D3E4|nr:TetR/AcrR family transcriptional regulator C-terminal domain-containing protein [Agrobacterium salinitolerans]QXC52744.1 TetR/AcrR family transcriptional regulator C-terminal domain-containing protein [Agrobacterium salinitolerans]
MERTLEKEIIIRAAFDLLSDQGLDAFSTRKVAAKLGVQQPSLYWHFRNKSSLLSAMVEDMLDRGGAHSTPRPDEPWPDFMLRSAHAFRNALLQCRDGARLFAGTKIIPRRLDAFENQLQYLITGGLNVKAATQLTISVGHFVVGCVMAQQASESTHSKESGYAPDLGEHDLLKNALENHAGADEVFEFGISALIAGCGSSIVNRKPVEGRSTCNFGDHRTSIVER